MDFLLFVINVPTGRDRKFVEKMLPDVRLLIIGGTVIFFAFLKVVGGVFA